MLYVCICMLYVYVYVCYTYVYVCYTYMVCVIRILYTCVEDICVCESDTLTTQFCFLVVHCLSFVSKNVTYVYMCHVGVYGLVCTSCTS